APAGSGALAQMVVHTFGLVGVGTVAVLFPLENVHSEVFKPLDIVHVFSTAPVVVVCWAMITSLLCIVAVKVATPWALSVAATNEVLSGPAPLFSVTFQKIWPVMF